MRRLVGADYLGEVPDGWEVRRIGSFLTERRAIVGEASDKYLLLSLTLNGVVPRDLENVKGKLPADFTTYQAVEPGDIVFCLFDVQETPRTVGLSHYSGMVTGAYTVMTITDAEAHPPFVAYAYLSYDQRKALQPYYAGLRNTLRTTDFRNVLIPFPSRVQQVDIARYLDRETAEIDAFIADQEELIGLLAERRAATISHAATKGLDPNAPMKDSGVKWLGDVPVHWSISRVAASVASSKNGVWGSDPSGQNAIRCVRVADFDRPRQRIHDRDVTFREILPSERVGRLLRRGDLLLEKSGGGEKSPVGFVVLFDREEPAVTSNFVARLTLRDGMDSRFWTYFHGFYYERRLTARSVKQSTGIQNLDQSSYFNEPAVFPSTAEQSKIADYLDRETAELDAAIADAREAIALSRERRAALISAAVTGKIDVRNHGEVA